MSTNQLKVAIKYGFSEGPWQGKKLRQELRQLGFSITKKPAEADIIIAHSGGCYMLPKQSQAKIVLLIGLPYNKTLHPSKSLLKKVRHDSKDYWWYKNLLFNSLYLFTHPIKWFRMWLVWKQSFIPGIETKQVIAVRNNDDPFVHPTDIVDLASDKGWRLKNLPGTHDDIWRNPQPYLDTLVSIIG